MTKLEASCQRIWKDTSLSLIHKIMALWIADHSNDPDSFRVIGDQILVELKWECDAVVARLKDPFAVVPDTVDEGRVNRLVDTIRAQSGL